jgi:hypothetical protein
MSKRNPFDYVKNVSYDKKDIMVDEVEEKSYAPFLVNRALSYHKDSIYFVNEMNTNHGLDNRLQYQFYINTLRKRNRFSKWSKPYESKKLETIKECYNVSTQKAKEYLSILSDKQYNVLKNSMSQGGTNINGRHNQQPNRDNLSGEGRFSQDT